MPQRPKLQFSANLQKSGGPALFPHIFKTFFTKLAILVFTINCSQNELSYSPDLLCKTFTIEKYAK